MPNRCRTDAELMLRSLRFISKSNAKIDAGDTVYGRPTDFLQWRSYKAEEPVVISTQYIYDFQIPLSL